mmetsp:Transcript_3405/g.4558  ORF Transcript_3405/g.4558 Transcript_3405/m.4558 type:complete len:80 (-) Transcript_3405:536-775(-)
MGQTCLSNAGGEKITSSQFITEPRIIENSSWNADTTNLWVQYVDQHSGSQKFLYLPNAFFIETKRNLANNHNQGKLSER